MAERVLGNVATRLLLEHERVRIWALDLAPGARSDTHRHEYPVSYSAATRLVAGVVPGGSRFTAAEVPAVVGPAAAETCLVDPEFVPLVERLRGESRLPDVRRVMEIGAPLDALAGAEL